MKRDELFDISNLIFRELAEELTSEERQRLEAWLDSSERNRTLYEHICSEKVMREKIREYKESDVQAAFEAFLARKERIGRERRLVRYVSRCAVVLVLPLVLAVWYWAKDDDVLPMRTETVAELAENVVKNRSILTLSSGRQMVVGDSSLSIAEEGGVRIQVDGNGMMSYNASDSSDVTDVYNTMRTPVQCDFVFTLEDGTRVWMNAASSLRYPVVFGGEERVVYAEGEIFFEVAKDAERPFRVHLGNGLEIRVLGTSFNVNSYAEEDFTEVTLVEGAVEAQFGEKAYKMRPNQQLYIDEAQGTTSLTEVDVNDYIAWKDGQYVFKNKPLWMVAKVLQRWYGVRVVFENEAARNSTFTGVINKNEGVGLLVERLNATSTLRCRIEGKEIYIR